MRHLSRQLIKYYNGNYHKNANLIIGIRRNQINYEINRRIYYNVLPLK